MSTIPLYTVEIRDQYGHLVQVLNRPMQKQFDIFRNKSGSAQFVLDLYDAQAVPQYLQLNVYDVVFRRQGTPVFAGQISFVEPVIDGDKKEVNVTVTGYFDLFDQRLITSDFPNYDFIQNKLVFNNVDTAQIAWNLINYSQFPAIFDGLATADGVQSLEQSFLVPSTTTLQTLQLLINNNTISGGNMIVSLIQDSGGLPKGSVVTGSTKTISVASLPTTLGWYSIDYSNVTVNLVQGQKYWIKVTLDTPQTNPNALQWAFLNGGYYPSGMAYSLEQTNLFTTDQDLQFFILMADNAFQMTKNTYFGIQQGSLPTSFNLSPQFDQYKKIKTAIEDLAKTFNGIDFSITVQIDSTTNIMTKYFNVYYPGQGVNNTSLPFTYPGNIKKIDRAKDGKPLQNEVILRGQGSGSAQLIAVVRDLPTIQAYSLRQGVQQESDINDAPTLTSIGNEFLRTGKNPIDLPKITLEGSLSPALGSYNVGDIIQIVLTGPPLISLTAQYRIEHIGLKISEDDMEEVVLTLSQA